MNNLTDILFSTCKEIENLQFKFVTYISLLIRLLFDSSVFINMKFLKTHFEHFN